MFTFVVFLCAFNNETTTSFALKSSQILVSVELHNELLGNSVLLFNKTIVNERLVDLTVVMTYLVLGSKVVLSCQNALVIPLDQRWPLTGCIEWRDQLLTIGF